MNESEKPRKTMIVGTPRGMALSMGLAAVLAAGMGSHMARDPIVDTRRPEKPPEPYETARQRRQREEEAELARARIAISAAEAKRKRKAEKLRRDAARLKR